ncbi:hypothetical protein HOE41_02865 [Candidatus Woesearchaeota archaeon]|nr:hypothetical protein [Candidatus Woesearchaeota archaeon]
MIYPRIQNQILSVLARTSGLSQKAIILSTGFSERCVRSNLKYLESSGAVSASRDIRNLNFKRYVLREVGAVV